MTTYIAWDGIAYPLPPPEGWYLASDERWWPEDHGPGPKAAGAEDGADSSDNPIPPALRGPTAAADAETAAEMTPAASADEHDDSVVADQKPISRSTGSRRGVLVKLIVAVGLLLLFGSVGYLVFLGGADEPEATDAPASTQVITDGGATDSIDAEDAGPTTSAVPSRGSSQDPYLIGEKIVLRYEAASGDGERVWEVVVLDVPLDRTDAVLAENQFNEPPEDGARFVVAPISVTYVSGPAPASLFDLNFKVVGPSGVVFTTFDPSCGVVPDAIDSLGELFPGGRIEGNICWTVASGDVDSLTMLVEVFLITGETYVDLATS